MHLILTILLTLTAAAISHSSILAAASSQKIFPSKLPLSIRGVITSSNPENSVALLQNNENGALVAVRSGFELYKTWTVVKIPNTKTIILKRLDRFEFLGIAPKEYDVVPH